MSLASAPTRTGLQSLAILSQMPGQGGAMQQQHAQAEAHAAQHYCSKPAAAEDSTLFLFDLPEHVLQLVYSHLSTRDRCSMRAACKAGAAALLFVQEATLSVMTPKQPQPQPGLVGLFSKLMQLMQPEPQAPPWPLARLAKRITALSRVAPNVTSLTLDLTGVSDSQESRSDQVDRMLAACKGLQHLQRLEVRSHTEEFVGLGRAPCAAAAPNECSSLHGKSSGRAAASDTAMHSAWRLKRVGAFADGCARFSPDVLAGMEYVRVIWDSSTLDSMRGEQGKVRLAGLAASLESVPEVELACKTICPPTQLLRVATHLLQIPADNGTWILDTAEFKAAAASGQVPRLRSTNCSIARVPHLPRSVSANLQQLCMSLKNDQRALDQLLTWPPGWLPSLHTLKIGLSDSRQVCVLRPAHAVALTAAAPNLGMLEFNGMQLSAPALAQLCRLHSPTGPAAVQ